MATLQDEVRALHSDGLTYRQIAERLGISLTHASRLGSYGVVMENTLKASREAKRRRHGNCSDCGAQTAYSGGPEVVGQRCVPCANRAIGIGARGSGPVVSEALAFMATPRRFKEIRDHLGITQAHTGSMLARLRSYGLIERVRRGLYVATSERLT